MDQYFNSTIMILLFRKRFIFRVFVLLSLITNSFAAVIYTDISQDKLTIGDKLEYTVALVVTPGTQIIPPETEDGWGNFIVKNWSTDRIERESSDSVTYKYLITTYTVESCSIPALPFIEVKEERHDTLHSLVIPMQVTSVIVADSGDTVHMKDIKPQQKAGTPSFLWLWIILTLLLVAGLLVLIRYFWIKSRKPPPPPPPVPPYEEAIAALRDLENKQLLTKGLLREYVFELSEILKRYTGRRFNANTAEYTTAEMLEWIPSAPFASELGKSLEWFFITSHPIKFAKIVPDQLTIKQFYEETLHFIEKTKPSQENSDLEQNSGGDQA